MPSRHIVKEFAPDTYYHLYNRGVNKRLIFKDEADYTVFLGMLKRYLSPELPILIPRSRHRSKNFSNRLELLAYCLMPNHFHLLVYQYDMKAISEFTQSLLTSYSVYFNKCHKRVGGLFQSRYHAARLTNDAYLTHISRYIHLNPRDYTRYPYSSYLYWVGQKRSDWLKPERLLEEFAGDRQQYARFVADYVDYKKTLDVLKSQIAD